MSSLKWRKYLKLVEFGFVSLTELEGDIARYTKPAVQDMLVELGKRLRQDEESNQRYLYVIKLVLPDLQGQLPNYRVETFLELSGLAQFLNKNAQGSHNEVWFCRTRIDDQIFSVAGRIIFARRLSMRNQIVEQLWRASPRLLESFSSECRQPYGRASRYSWGWSYSVDQIHTPSGSELSDTQLREQFLYSLLLLEHEREKIELFCEFLESFEFTTYSLEYKIVGSRLAIIDWDTPNDRKVILSA